MERMAACICCVFFKRMGVFKGGARNKFLASVKRVATKKSNVPTMLGGYVLGGPVLAATTTVGAQLLGMRKRKTRDFILGTIGQRNLKSITN
jgi:hypothetical protein